MTGAPAGVNGAPVRMAAPLTCRWRRELALGEKGGALCASVAGEREVAVGTTHGEVVLFDTRAWKPTLAVEDAGGPVSAVELVPLRYVNPETRTMKKTWQMVTATQNGRLRAWSKEPKPSVPPESRDGEDDGDVGGGGCERGKEEQAVDNVEGDKQPAEGESNDQDEPEVASPAWHLWTDVFAEPKQGAFGPHGYGPRITALVSFEASWSDWKPEDSETAESDVDQTAHGGADPVPVDGTGDGDGDGDGDEEQLPDGEIGDELPAPRRPEPFVVLAAATAAGVVLLFDTHLWEILPTQLRHDEGISALLVLPGKSMSREAGDELLPQYARSCRLVAASLDRVLCVWGQPRRYRDTRRVLLGKQTSVALSLAPWRDAFASGHGDGTVLLWKCETNAVGDDSYLKTFILQANAPVRSLVSCGDGDIKVVAGDGSGNVTVWREFDEDAGERLAALRWVCMRRFEAFPSGSHTAVSKLLPLGMNLLAVGDGAHVWR